MAVSETPKAARAPRLRRSGATREVRRTDELDTAATEARSAEVRKIADSVSVMGIPENELTPKVRTTLVALMAEVEGMRKKVERARERLATLERLADQDPLAPLANRLAFVRELARYISVTERYETPNSVAYFDLNCFKGINDTHGHSAGDAALLRVANVLLESVRDSDVVGRLGGDEFAVILAQSDLPAALDKAETLASAISAAPFEWEGQPIPLTVAYGVYTFKPGESVDDALAAADRAMYANKHNACGAEG